MIEHGKIKECIDTIFHPDYEKGILKVREDASLILFVVMPEENDWWRLSIWGFENEVYSEPQRVEGPKLLEIFEDCLYSFSYDNKHRKTNTIPFILQFNNQELDFDDNYNSFQRYLILGDDNVQIFKTAMSALRK